MQMGASEPGRGGEPFVTSRTGAPPDNMMLQLQGHNTDKTQLLPFVFSHGPGDGNVGHPYILFKRIHNNRVTVDALPSSPAAVNALLNICTP